MALAPFSVNHRFPSGPEVMPPGGQPFAEDTGNSVIVPVGVMRPMLLDVALSGWEGSHDAHVNHRLPSGPTVMRPAPL